LTLGTGVRMDENTAATGLAFSADEPTDWGRAGDVLRRRTGRGPGAAAIVHLGLPALRRRQPGTRAAQRMGLIGDALAAAGVRRVVTGNLDLPQRTNRPAVCLLVDRHGRVDEGLLAQTSVVNATAPLGLATDWPLLTDTVARCGEGATAIVVQIPVLHRAELFAATAEPDLGTAARRRALTLLDRWLDGIAAVLDPARDALVVLSPAPDAAAVSLGDTFTPVLAWGRGFAPGLLASATTRRPGLVANTDLAPTILEWFHLSEAAVGTDGRPWSSVAVPPTPGLAWFGADNAVVRAGRTLTPETLPGGDQGRGGGELSGTAQLLLLHDRFRAALDQRGWLIRAFIFYQMFVMVLAVWARLRRHPSALTIVRPLAVSLLLGLVALILLPLFPPRGPVVTAALMVGMTAAGTGLACLSPGTLALICRSCLALCLVIATDLLTGARLLATSPLGYSPAGGARFYGVGNEFMGAFVGAALMAGAGLAARAGKGRRSLVSALVGGGPPLAATYLLAHPGLGANLGGAFAAGAGTAWLMTELLLGARSVPRRLEDGKALAWWSGRPWLPPVVALAGGLLAAAALVACDLGLPGGQGTHVAQAVDAARQGGLPEILATAGRKLTTNLRLIRYTIWSRVFLVLLASFVFLVMRHRPQRGAADPADWMWPGWRAVGTAAVAALLVNDSGVVAAAVMFLFPSVSGALALVGDPPGDTGRSQGGDDAAATGKTLP